MGLFRRSEKQRLAEKEARSRNHNSLETDRTPTSKDEAVHPSKQQIKRATRTRLVWAILTSFLLLVSVVFLILVEIGNTQKSQKVLTDIYFIKLDLSNIAPQSIPNAVLLNSIARTLGLHDFYQVGLWNFCEGYNGDGVTDCSSPETLYWFNPVEILVNELLSGATISLPTDVTNILNIIKVASAWMFGLFLSGACLTFLLIPILPLSVFSRLLTLPIALFTLLAAILTTVATVIATVMFIIMRNAFTSVTELNIGATLGTEMFAFMWIASATAILAALVQVGLCCCCASRRDVRLGKKKGSRKAWNEGEAEEKPRRRRGLLGRR
ncbi:hypothetical protein M8818_002226 [Zalaria obscura]|uniref:Uncharacterized protein n=1 Tax=Zalaria obscura TaxID=2024903 RepID=A0ACC3SIU9_9PEZI